MTNAPQSPVDWGEVPPPTEPTAPRRPARPVSAWTVLRVVVCAFGLASLALLTLFLLLPPLLLLDSFIDNVILFLALLLTGQEGLSLCVCVALLDELVLILEVYLFFALILAVREHQVRTVALEFK